MSSTGSEDDPSFLSLPTRLRRRIDSTFDSTASPGTQSWPSRFEAAPGGFIVEESEPGPSQSTNYEAGWFIVEGHPTVNPSDNQTRIPLSEIPRALNFLDLFPDDDIMEVFRNAATGWGAQSARVDGVSRKDWRAICAALLEGERAGGSDKENPDEDVEMDADSNPDSDEYRTEGFSSGTEEVSDGEYEEPSRTAGGVSKAQQISRRTPTEGVDLPRQLTEAQKAQCRRDFGRFLPHVPDSELDDQRITIKDIDRVADLLKESLKTEQILEMLEAFSTSPDRSMNLSDFEHMMILTKLV